MEPTGTSWLNSRTAFIGLLALGAFGCDPDDPRGEPEAADASVSSDGASRDAAVHPGPDAGGGRVDAGAPVEEDGGFVCCLAIAVCDPGEESYDTMAECEAAGDGCTEHSICCSTVVCRTPDEPKHADCAGDVVTQEGCDADGYCVPLGDGEYCAGERGACELGAHPITADVTCPDGHTCADAPDGQRCAMRSYADADACLLEGSYATPATGALELCDSGDATLGWIAGFEPSLCCLDTNVANGCEPMDAQGIGACERFFGWSWDGKQCTGVSGCSCEGADCDALTQELDTCVQSHMDAECLPPDCRKTGCGAGASCNLCWGGWACLPDGAVC